MKDPNDPIPEKKKRFVAHSAIPEAEKLDPSRMLFRNPQRGDAVIVEDPEDPVLFRLSRIVTFTKTLVFVDGQRYQRQDGIRFGLKHYDYPQRVHPATRRNLKRVEEYHMRRDLKAAVANALAIRVHELVTLEEGKKVLKELENAFAGIIDRRNKA